ncbi:MAG: hypothetical protein IJP48_07505 [Synergistaceae bacterium]|nr:hypothetical protein [Synergistaceae bacterium]
MRKVFKRLSALLMLVLMLVTSIAVDAAPSYARVTHRTSRYRYYRSPAARRRAAIRRRRAIRRARARRLRRTRYYY